MDFKPCLSYSNLCELFANNYTTIKNGLYSINNSELYDNNATSTDSPKFIEDEIYYSDVDNEEIDTNETIEKLGADLGLKILNKQKI